jgi:hypothetical protein
MLGVALSSREKSIPTFPPLESVWRPDAEREGKKEESEKI